MTWASVEHGSEGKFGELWELMGWDDREGRAKMGPSDKGS